MKIQAFLKIAVVATAALAAYAFSGNANSQSQFSFYDDMSGCTDIVAGCTQNGLENCIIQVNNNSKDVLGLRCTTEVKHISDQPVNWSYLD